jgi:hypothetical protein
MTNGPRRSGSSFFEGWGNALKYKMRGWRWRAEESLPPSTGHFVAHPTGYSWRVALPQSPLPLHRLKRSLRLNAEGVKKKSSNSGLTGKEEPATLAPSVENQPALRGTNTA